MGFEPEESAVDARPVVIQNTRYDGDTATWRPLFRHSCAFGATAFDEVMVNLIQNPNINSSWLFRADILYDAPEPPPCTTPSEVEGSPCIPIPSFVGFELRRCIIRRLIPRNTLRDKPLDQTCLVYENASDHGDDTQTLVVYLPHVSAASKMPFYHPIVRGIAFLHEWDATESCGVISISYLFFSDSDRSSNNKLTRTALHLLEAIYKHGKGRLEGYQKRVHHDQLLPQARLQNTYTRLKQKYARPLIKSWAEVTDPEKHVFEDLCIAAFLIELWADTYGQDPFPGFVDIGCGNGLLVYILIQEGFMGWGFDARSRKSWAAYNTKVQTSGGEEDSLRQLVLLPFPVSKGLADASRDEIDEKMIHDGRFPKGTFIISNHADELTPWTPIIAAISECPFIAIPCCSHNLTGERFRAPVPKDKTKADTAYSSLVVWVSDIARDCGWEVEDEMLRIPSTRNAAVVGRKRSIQSSSLDIQAIVNRYGGTAGYMEAVIKLVASAPQAHDDENHGHHMEG
jgi:tRNASer (uridine44-2'-O)-methyltransferase